MAVNPPQATPQDSERVDLADRPTLFLQAKTGRDLADVLGVRHSDLNAALYWRARVNYRVFEIPKRRGGTRTIRAPMGILAVIQSNLAAVLQEVYEPRSCVHGFRKQRSIVTNAWQHTGRRLVLNVDLKDFFPSINFGRVRGLFIARPYNLPPRVATILAQICCYENELPQGAPTSPIISNMICARMDGELQRLARRCKCSYSRYADDLTFSTTFREFPAGLATTGGRLAGPGLAIGSALRAVIESNGFRINEEKQRLMLHDCHQEVTGLTVNRYPNTKRSYVRQLRGMLHAWETHGLDEAERVSFPRVVRGKLEFLAMVKGIHDPVYLALRERLHALDDGIIGPAPSVAPSGWASPHFQRYQNLVHMVEVHLSEDRITSGSAFVLDRSRLVTARHNLEEAIEVVISPPWPKNTPVSSWILHPNDKIDLAIVPLGDILPSLPAQLSIRTDPLQVGEDVAAIAWAQVPKRQPAHPGLYCGVVESRLPTYSGDIELIQVSIQFGGGMSGGPVIDSQGRLVGVVTETTFSEKVAENLPHRQYFHIVPVKYLPDLLAAEKALKGDPV